MSLPVFLRNTAVAAAACVLVMLMIFLITGVGQDPLQSLHPPEAYAALLLRDPPVLRAVLAVDNIFVALYVSTFITAGLILVQGGASRGLVWISVALLGLTGLLDLLENLHFLTLLGLAEQGTAILPLQIQGQVIESLLKFHFSYVGLFLFGSSLPLAHPLGRLLARLSWWVQLPVGVAIYVVPPTLALPLVLVRFSYFLAGLLLLAVIFGRGTGGSSAPASLPSTRPGVAG